MPKICKTRAMDYKEGYSEENGIKIAYRDYGPEGAEPILLVHGLGAQLVHWPDHLINFLIENNFSVYWNYKYNLKKSLSFANEKKINYLIIIGENEKSNNNFSIKNLSNGKQFIVNIDNIIDYLK